MADPQRTAHVWNFRSRWVGGRRFLGYNGAAADASKSNHKGVCSQPRSGRVHEPRMTSKNFLHGNLNGIIRRDKHRSALAYPLVNLVVFLLKLDQDLLADDQLSLVDEPIESLPHRRKDFRRVCASPGVQDGTRVKAVGQETAPVLRGRPSTAASILGRCRRRTSRKSETSLAVMCSWW